MKKGIIGSALVLLALVGCSATTPLSSPASENDAVPTAALVKPDIDFSKESPDCETAGQRIAEHIEVGMTLSNVARLVGRPSFKLPGSWWWSASFDKSGKPFVLYNALDRKTDKEVTKLSSDTSNC